MRNSHTAFDTAPDALAVQLRCISAMTPKERMERMFQMSHQAKQMAFAAIRRRFPDFDENEVQLKFIELNFGIDLANEVRRWKASQQQ